MNKKSYEKPVFTDDLIFALVMRDEAICRGLLERILPDTEFGEIRLANKEHPLFSEEPLTVEQQKSLQLGLDAHGVRFDVFAKTKLPFDDERFTIVLNTKCDLEKVPDRLKPLFAYINDPERKDDDFVRMLDERVQKFSSEEWRAKQMTLGHMLEQAEARGENRGEERINKLYEKLLESGRIDEMKRAMQDKEYRKKLLEEFGL